MCAPQTLLVRTVCDLRRQTTRLGIPPNSLADCAYTEAIEGYERRLIDAGLARCGGHNKIAARLPGIACTALRDRIEKYGLSAVA
jgi:DNA-binding NtrC family response regulator